MKTNSTILICFFTLCEIIDIFLIKFCITNLKEKNCRYLNCNFSQLWRTSSKICMKAKKITKMIVIEKNDKL